MEKASLKKFSRKKAALLTTRSRRQDNIQFSPRQCFMGDSLTIDATVGSELPNAMMGKVYAQKLKIDVVILGQRRACPLEWLDQFCMRNFTNAAEFDDTLPVAEGQIEASFRLTPERFAEGLGAWLTQRGKGEGQPVRVEVTSIKSI